MRNEFRRHFQTDSADGDECRVDTVAARAAHRSDDQSISSCHDGKDDEIFVLCNRGLSI